MTSLPPQIETRSYNWWTDRAGLPVLVIVIHGTKGTDSRKYLSRGGDLPDGSDRKVSIHRLGNKDGSICQYVPDARAANHAGAESARLTIGGRTYRAGEVNRISLGYELENLQDGKDPYPDVQLLSMGWQIAMWRRQHGNLPIFRHAVIDPGRRSDPVGLNIAQIEGWVQQALIQMRNVTRVKVGPIGAIAQQDYYPEGKAARYYPPGTILAVTPDFYENDYYHVAAGDGFIPAGQVDPLPA